MDWEKKRKERKKEAKKEVRTLVVAEK